MHVYNNMLSFRPISWVIFASLFVCNEELSKNSRKIANACVLLHALDHIVVMEDVHAVRDGKSMW